MNTRGPAGITWKNIRLELAETPEFPQGSATRAYILHLPFREDGWVDEEAFQANPAIAGFRRFWPNEPDGRGLVVRRDNGWALSFHAANGDGEEHPIFMDRLLPGDPVMIGAYGSWGQRFRVVDLSFGSGASP